MINIIKNITRIDSLKQQYLPNHLAISAGSLDDYKKQDIDLIELSTKKVGELINTQIKLNIPIFTIRFNNKSEKDTAFINSLIKELLIDERLHTNKIKVMIIGNWFDLPIETTEKIKKLMEETKDYDNFFLNLLINYDGREEIIAAIKLLTLKAINKQIDPEKIDAALIKESLYTSYFVPPEILIECSYTYSGTLLWDLPYSRIYLTGSKHWLDLDKKELDDALNAYKKSKVEAEKSI